MGSNPALDLALFEQLFLLSILIEICLQTGPLLRCNINYFPIKNESLGVKLVAKLPQYEKRVQK